MTKNILYLDMDGVVADWTEGAARIVGYHMSNPNQYYPNKDWEKIRTHQRMFLDLPLMPRANELVELAKKFCKEFDYDLLFLTAVPHYNDIHWAFWDKMKWAEQHFPGIPVHFGPYSGDKSKHCKPGDILVDDREDNCDHWQAAGGVAINVPYTNYQQAITQLQALYDQKKSLKNLRDLKASAVKDYL